MGYTMFLFANPSGLEGAARLLDLSGTMTIYNEARNPAEADAIALAMDFAAVGLDLASAIASEIPENKLAQPQLG